jgi:hypothetical protein
MGSPGILGDKVRIFLSYASEIKDVAEPIAFSLRARGHKVFLDKDDLPPGRSYDDQIAQAIEESDLFIFLISPESVTKGRYTLTELGFARQKWPVASRNILPVVVKAVDFAHIPSYLKSVTVLEPLGNVAAEVSNAVQRLGHGAPIRVVLPIMAGLGLVSGVIGGLLPNFLPDIPTDADLQKALLLLNVDNAPLHVALLFSIVVGGALWFWERTSAWALIGLVVAIFAGWITAHNAWRHLFVSITAVTDIARRIPDTIENANQIKAQFDTLTYIAVLAIGAFAGALGALFTAVGAFVGSTRLRKASVIMLVIGLGAVFGLPALYMGNPETRYITLGLWQMSVAAAIGYGLSRPLQ